MEFFPNFYSPQSTFNWQLDTSNATSYWSHPKPLNCLHGPGWKAKTGMVNNSITGQNCYFTPNILVNETGVWEENKTFSHPVHVRSPEESMVGRSEMWCFFFSNLDLIHSAFKCLWKVPTSTSGVLVLEFDGDNFTLVYSANTYSSLGWEQNRTI